MRAHTLPPGLARGCDRRTTRPPACNVALGGDIGEIRFGLPAAAASAEPGAREARR